MHRRAWIAAAIVLTFQSGAWAQEKSKPSEGRGGSSTSGEKQGPRPDKPARKGAKSRQPEAPGVDPATRARVKQTKQVLMFAVEACERSPERCDKPLRDDAERRFLDTCGICAPSERCLAERDAIRAGTSKASANPCGSP